MARPDPPVAPEFLAVPPDAALPPLFDELPPVFGVSGVASGAVVDGVSDVVVDVVVDVVSGVVLSGVLVVDELAATWAEEAATDGVSLTAMTRPEWPVVTAAGAVVSVLVSADLPPAAAAAAGVVRAAPGSGGKGGSGGSGTRLPIHARP
jgi:hypothetical protein